MYKRRIKDTKQAIRSQVKLKTSLPTLYIDPIKQFPHYIADCTDAERLVYNILVKCSFLFKRMFMGQEAIARMAGVCLKTVGRALKKFHKAGLLMKIGRHEKTCIYKLPTFIFEQSIRYQLSYLLPALQFVALTLLFSTNNCQSESCPTSNYSFIKTSQSQHKQYNCKRLNTEKVENLRLKNSENSRFCCDVKKKRVVMSKMTEVYGSEPASPEDLLPKAVQNITSIKLTLAGKVWLSPFPEHVLKKIDCALAKAVNVNDPFRYLFKSAMEECRSQGIQPDWEKRRILTKEFHVSDNSPLFTDYVPNTAKPTTSPVDKSSFVANRSSSQSSFQGKSRDDNIRYNSAHSSMTESESKKIVPEDPREELAKYEKLYQANPNEFLAILINEMKKNLEMPCT